LHPTGPAAFAGHGHSGLAAWTEVRKGFFFEKKKQKTFDPGF
jgi:hypothetical protein